MNHNDEKCCVKKRKEKKRKEKPKATRDFIGSDAIDADDEAHSARFLLQLRVVQSIGLRMDFRVPARSSRRFLFHLSIKSIKSIKNSQLPSEINITMQQSKYNFFF